MFAKKYLPLFFLLIQIVLIQIIGSFPELVEKYYSTSFYPIWSKIVRVLFNYFSFSVGDLLYLMLIIYLIYSLYRVKKTTGFNWKNQLIKTLNFCSIFYFLFHFAWGINYYRVPLFEKMNIQKEYSHEDLIAFTENMISKCNALQLEITKNKSTKIELPYGQSELFKMSQLGYEKLEKTHPMFHFEAISSKKSLFSEPLSYMGFGGYLNPFTNEAQINYTTPKYRLPATICHEMAHQIGFASESECNFIAYLAAKENPSLYFQFSAHIMALKYCLKNIRGKDTNDAKITPFLKKLNKGILENFKDDEIHYEKYYTMIDVFFEFIYDNFLKMNQQEEGIESYSKFLNLLINYEKQNIK
jgi:hypothetical protein